MNEIHITQNTTEEIHIKAKGDWRNNNVRFIIKSSREATNNERLVDLSIALMLYDDEKNFTDFYILMLPTQNYHLSKQWRYYWDLVTNNSEADRKKIKQGELLVTHTLSNPSDSIIEHDLTIEELFNYINNQEESEMFNLFGPTRKVNSTIINVGQTAVQLPNNIDAKWVQFMHDHPTAKVYIGGNDVSLLNGFGALSKEDTSERYPVQNSNVFYAISDTQNVSLRMMWGEF